ncbi:hypothetical protein OEZ85_011474 [Tetradesmus obliquus]|uniref:Uncharacterized protein n=1 Tax=Tetradesmus obliquus TaxID=3088 RepID=A0ABY8TQF9_TETOB|nr:hypothetical protein OEZ85_011474 [Tetradesmus obliquus]
MRDQLLEKERSTSRASLDTSSADRLQQWLCSMELRSALHGITGYFNDMTGADALKTTAASDTPARNNSRQKALPAEPRAAPPDRHETDSGMLIATAEHMALQHPSNWPAGDAKASLAGWRQELPPPAFVLLGIAR